LQQNLELLVKSDLLIEDKGSYSFNESLSEKLIRHRIEVPILIPFKVVEKRTLENEREVAVEAAIVKIMK